MFDSAAELLEKIRLGEDSFLEPKEVRFTGQRVTGPREDALADDLAAFANGRGGVCVLGVDDAPDFLVRLFQQRSQARIIRFDEQFVPAAVLDDLDEALVNAVAHRDYSIDGAKIRLRMFADRLELYSPGAIPNTMTVDSLPYRQAARNEALTSLLAKCPVSESEHAFTGRSALMDKRGEGCKSSWTTANACPAIGRFTACWMSRSCGW